MISVAHNLESSVFRAATAREALTAARDSLGDDAVVISTRTIPNVISGGGYVEVIARAAHPGARPAAPRPTTPARPVPVSTPAAAAARYRSTTQAPAAASMPMSAAMSMSPMSSSAADFGGLGSVGGDSLESLLASSNGPGAFAAPPSPASGTRGPWRNSADPPWTHRGARSVGVFVGPTGAGKTTTLVKVAARAVMLHGLRPLLVTFDVWRAGAVAQLESYGRALGLETMVVENPRDMRRVLERDDAQMILVDTAGRSPRDVTALEKQSTYASALGLHRAHLCVPATFSETAMQQAVAQYSCFAIEDTIVTKIDEAGGHDDIERVANIVRMPVCAATNGQNIVEDILPTPSSSGYAANHAQSYEEGR